MKRTISKIQKIIGISTLLFTFSIVTTFAQTKIYNFQQVDSLPTFQNCGRVHKSQIDAWIGCFYAQLEKQVVDSIQMMCQQVGMDFEGLIKVNFSIDSTGKVYEATMKNKPHPILKKGAVDVLKSLTTLKPAILNGQAVAVNLTMEIPYFKDGNTPANQEIDTTIYPLKSLNIYPSLPDCGSAVNNEEKFTCSYKSLGKYLLPPVYPAKARENGIDGTVIISWVIEKDGFVSNVRVERDIGEGCGEANRAIYNRLITKKVKWNPAIKNGEPVRTKMFMPLKFTLGDGEKSKTPKFKVRF